MEPIILNFDYLNHTEELFSLLNSEPYAAFLDSSSHLHDHSGRATLDIISAAPYSIFIAENDLHYSLGEDGKTLHGQGDSLKKLEKLMDIHLSKTVQVDELPQFCGGALGYVGYHANDPFFKIEAKKTDDAIPDICMGFYAWTYVTNHKNKTSQIVYWPELDKNKSSKKLIQKIEDWFSKRENVSTDKPFLNNTISDQNFNVSEFTNMPFEEYESAFNRVKSYIHAGDCYQVNLAQRFKLKQKQNSWDSYLALRSKSPTPYSAFFRTPFGDILSFSPESFLKIDRFGIVESSPIKGTISRGKSYAEDKKLAAQLKASVKDQAENLMIVDLIRNDLSKTCELQSVTVETLFGVESFANVHHLVSKITAKLKKDTHPFRAFIAAFPGGSITGAPKKRAMEIIDELEPDSRQIYCGSIGYWSFNNNMEFNIAIRTVLIKDKNAFCWGGGGLVADSILESEHKESVTKVENLLKLF